jgi:hypothetical protein
MEYCDRDSLCRRSSGVRVRTISEIRFWPGVCQQTLLVVNRALLLIEDYCLYALPMAFGLLFLIFKYVTHVSGSSAQGSGWFANRSFSEGGLSAVVHRNEVKVNEGGLLPHSKSNPQARRGRRSAGRRGTCKKHIARGQEAGPGR